MQLYSYDLLMLATLVFRNRPQIFFGEHFELGRQSHVPTNLVAIAEQGLSGVKAIKSTLNNNGVFSTLADFVYEGRSALEYQLFGMTRSCAKAFLQIAQSTNSLLLPITTRTESNSIIVKVYEPIEITNVREDRDEKMLQQKKLLFLLGMLFEKLIRSNPTQWLLLNTLIANSPQMAKGTVI